VISGETLSPEKKEGIVVWVHNRLSGKTLKEGVGKIQSRAGCRCGREYLGPPDLRNQKENQKNRKGRVREVGVVIQAPVGGKSCRASRRSP